MSGTHNDIKLYLYEISLSEPEILQDCVSFSFDKNRYIPYSSFSGRFILSKPSLNGEAYGVSLLIDGKYVHTGAVDKLKVSTKDGATYLDITSRGYSLALSLNEPQPGMISNVNLSSLMEINTGCPLVSCQEGTPYANYIYVKEHSSIWDAMVAYTQKMYGTYPFIRDTNTVTCAVNMFSSFLIPDEKVTERGEGSNFSRLVSHIHQKDINGTYYNLEYVNYFAEPRLIVRHKYIGFDDQWASNMQAGLMHRSNFLMREVNYEYITYFGYQGEDIYDLSGVESWPSDLRTIHRIVIKGSSGKGIQTTRYFFTDGYCSH